MTTQVHEPVAEATAGTEEQASTDRAVYGLTAGDLARRASIAIEGALDFAGGILSQFEGAEDHLVNPKALNKGDLHPVKVVWYAMNRFMEDLCEEVSGQGTASGRVLHPVDLSDNLHPVEWNAVHEQYDLPASEDADCTYGKQLVEQYPFEQLARELKELAGSLGDIEAQEEADFLASGLYCTVRFKKTVYAATESKGKITLRIPFFYRRQEAAFLEKLVRSLKVFERHAGVVGLSAPIQKVAELNNQTDFLEKPDCRSVGEAPCKIRLQRDMLKIEIHPPVAQAFWSYLKQHSRMYKLAEL